VKFDLPGLFPIKITKLSKRKMPRTILSTAYNYQKRLDFDRGVFQFNYTYKFVLNKTQLLQFGFPFASVVKFVAINKNEAFEQKLNQNNDLFLRNAYSDQFIWQDFKVTFEYNNKIEKKGKTTVFYNATFDHAGLLTSWISNKNDTATLQKQIFGVPYSQFARLDNEVIVGYPINKDKSFNFRFVAGAGIPYGNTKTSMPYDYSFFAGGANDNRGWRARSLGPGAYKYYLDTNRTATQIGDIRLGGSAEYRFSMSKLFKGAVFLDAANVWTTQNDVKRPGGQFSNNWYKEIAYSAGVGLRIDFSFFIVRLDLGLPINNPAMPAGSRWIFQSRKAYYDEGLSVLGPDYKSIMPKPFIPSLNFGIGYPF
jgi:outer membrane protein assembly factor BamA